MILSVTGHRPHKLGGYSAAVTQRLIALATAALCRYRPRHVLTGMALGWDQAIAEACIELAIPYTAVIPFIGQEAKWRNEQVERYHYRYLANAAAKVYPCGRTGGFSAAKLRQRNEYLVTNSQALLALYNGSLRSGTGHCVRFAHKQNKRVINVWASWQKYG